MIAWDDDTRTTTDTVPIWAELAVGLTAGAIAIGYLWVFMSF